MSDQKVLDLRRPPHPKRHWAKLLKRSGLALLACAIVAAGAWLIWSHWFQKPDLNNVAVVKRLVARHYVLPADEEPALATVTDTTKLQTPFLKQSQNGDKLLVYQKAARAIIYRPSIDRIIDIGPVSLEAPNTGH